MESDCCCTRSGCVERRIHKGAKISQCRSPHSAGTAGVTASNVHDSTLNFIGHSAAPDVAISLLPLPNYLGTRQLGWAPGLHDVPLSSPLGPTLCFASLNQLRIHRSALPLIPRLFTLLKSLWGGSCQRLSGSLSSHSIHLVCGPLRGLEQLGRNDSADQPQ